MECHPIIAKLESNDSSGAVGARPTLKKRHGREQTIPNHSISHILPSFQRGNLHNQSKQTSHMPKQTTKNCFHTWESMPSSPQKPNQICTNNLGLSTIYTCLKPSQCCNILTHLNHLHLLVKVSPLEAKPVLPQKLQLLNYIHLQIIAFSLEATPDCTKPEASQPNTPASQASSLEAKPDLHKHGYFSTEYTCQVHVCSLKANPELRLLKPNTPAIVQVFSL